MCTVSIHIDEEAIRKHNPALSTKKLIQQWLQRQVDIMMEDCAHPFRTPMHE